MESSSSSPSFTYQLGQRAYDRRFNGRIAEIIIYNRALSTEEANSVGGYLAVKYGIETAYVTIPPTPPGLLYPPYPPLPQLIFDDIDGGPGFGGGVGSGSPRGGWGRFQSWTAQG